MSASPVSPTTINRYELKFKIPSSMVDPISNYVAMFCDMDYYSQISPNGFYLINSLYLDTPARHFYRRKKRGDPNYFCMRIRSYGADPKPPYYFESKQHDHAFSKKRRGKVSIENFADLLTCPETVTNFDYQKDKHVMDFMHKAQMYGASPSILTQYRRRAFLSNLDDYARVTFDRDLRYQEAHSYDVWPNEKLMTHYDHPDTIDHTGRNVILELKCERQIPYWMANMVRLFELKHDGFSKVLGGTYDLYTPFDRDRVSTAESRAILRNPFSALSANG